MSPSSGYCHVLRLEGGLPLTCVVSGSCTCEFKFVHSFKNVLNFHWLGLKYK